MGKLLVRQAQGLEHGFSSVVQKYKHGLKHSESQQGVVQREEDPESACWPDSLDSMLSSRTRERYCLKN